MKRVISEYCVGCGLCKACSTASIVTDSKGFYYPNNGNEEWLNSICPIIHSRVDEHDTSSIWGRREAVYYGWSNNNNIRVKAASGGVITEVALYLLNSNVVDAIIHTCVDPKDQTKNIVTLSTTSDDVINKCGSRYSISHPLEIFDSLDFSKRYAFIGKPCDIVALRNYMEIRPEISQSMIVLLSFFCMGLPSFDAQEKLLSVLNTDKHKCASLSYRGNGWPGLTTSINQDGKKASISYSTSWGKILGRDVMKACKVCIDGIGEAADISCADAWYIGDDNRPDFAEREGRNAVFARTKIGSKILEDMHNQKLISLEPIKVPEAYLRIVQHSQLYRRATLRSRISALRFMNKPYPNYPKDVLIVYGNSVSLKERTKAFWGTCKRIIKGKF